MRVLNVNEEIRKQVVKLYEDSDFFTNYDYDVLMKKIEPFYRFIKENNEVSRYVIGVMFTTSYVYNYDKYLKYLEEEYEDRIGLYETLSSPRKIIEVMSKNDFLNLCDDVCAFEELSFFGKKTIFINAKDKQDWLKGIFPPYLIDVLFYKNTYDEKRIMDDYFHRYKNNGGDLITAVECSVFCEIESLKKLKCADYNNYRYIILEILKDYYCYIKFLVSTNKQPNDDKKNIVFQIENNLERFFEKVSNDEELLDKVLSEYVLYNISSHEQIVAFYDKEPQGNMLVKVAKECDRLKRK